MLLVEQELLTIPEYLSYPRSSCRVGVAQFIVFCVVFLRSLFVILSSDFWLLYCHSIYGFYGLRLMHLQTFLGFSNYNVSVTYFCYFKLCLVFFRPSWPWYNYLCNQCLSPLMLRVQISFMARCTTLCDKVCQWFATGWWFSPGYPVSSTNKTDHHDITEILLTVALDTIKQTNLCLYIWFHHE